MSSSMVSLISQERKFNSEIACCVAFCACATHNGCSTCCLRGIGQNVSLSPSARVLSGGGDGDPPSTQWARWCQLGGPGTHSPLPSRSPAPRRLCGELHSLPLTEWLWVSFHSHSHCVFCLEMASRGALKVNGRGSMLHGQGLTFVRKERSSVHRGRKPAKSIVCTESSERRDYGWFPVSLHFLWLLSKFWHELSHQKTFIWKIKHIPFY